MAEESSKPQLLIVEDDAMYADRMVAWFFDDHDCRVVTTAEYAVDEIKKTEYDAILLDLELKPGEMTGMDFLEKHLKDLPTTPVIVVTRFKEMESIKRAFQLGAFHYHTKDLHVQELDLYLARAFEWRRMKRQLLDAAIEVDGLSEHQIVRKSPGFIEALENAQKVAGSPTPVLLTGETGTGKTIMARYIHGESARKGAFIEMNCGAIPNDQLQAELYGVDKGRAAGVSATRRGMLERTHRGTLFLDEICDVELSSQRKLLKAIDEGEFYRLGAAKRTKVNTRIVAAASRDLAAMVEAGTFSDALYYRLNAFHIHIPPLRERPEDLDALIDYYVDYHARRLDKPISKVSNNARLYLTGHTWPGNVRELSNAIEAAIIRRSNGELTATDFYLPTDEPDDIPAWRDAKEAAELALLRRYVPRVMEMASGNVTEAASIAGVAKMQVYRWFKKLGLEAEDFRVT